MIQMQMQIDLKSMLLSNTPYVPSPNFNERPHDADIDLIVIHNISLPPGNFGGPHIDSLFTNSLDKTIHPYFQEIEALRVSSHCLIRREGLITQYVPFNFRAWHAGQSVFEGRENCNDYSIGIELEGADEIPYSQAQYSTLVDLIFELQKIYPKITMERIVGHSTIAPDRKTDPGIAFNWDLLKTMLTKKNER